MKSIFLTALLLLSLVMPLAAPAQTVSDPADPFPEDAVLALSSIVAQMRGWPIDGLPVSLMPGGTMQTAESKFRYQGFEVKHVELIELKFLRDNPLHRYMQAVIHFTDRQGRLALAQLAAEYALYENEGIMLRNVGVWPVFYHAPRFEMFAVPVPQLEAAGKSITGSYERMYDFAQKHNATSGSGDFALMVFSKDRIEPGSKIEYILNSDPREDDPDDSLSKFSQINDNGWTVAVAQGPMQPGDMENLLYVNVFFTCTHDARNLANSFDTSMKHTGVASQPFQNPGQRLIAGQPGAYAPQAPATQHHQPAGQMQRPVQQTRADGPLGQGRMLLNPIFPDHVQFIQLRLQDLGYYKGAIDMEFGPATQQALGNFAQQQGMPRDQWSLDLQRALFRGSGQ